ncbi:MAG: SUMF1/EgtB/PvdO family nonheme iron enzyme [Immundisolibacterales bacterium]|nr:SUMF1/EgtB/PvdO family nonheme iron enzyme [Immundisolibacterales bacterium]
MEARRSVRARGRPLAPSPRGRLSSFPMSRSSSFEGAFLSRPSLDAEIPGTAEAASAAAGEEAPVAAPVRTPESVEVSLGLTFEDRVLVQHGLSSLGEDVGGADGVFGRRTRAGIRSYQEKKGLAATGHLTAELRDALVARGEAHAAKLGQEEAAREAERLRVDPERRADDEAFFEAKRLNTPGGYRSYLDRGGRHESEARVLLAEVSKQKLEVGKTFRDCPGCPEMVVVPAGSYEMGSPSWEQWLTEEGPVHRVTIRKPFAVGVHEVTREEWRRFVEATGHSSGDSCRTHAGGEWKKRSGRSWRQPGYVQDDEHPVACVSWEDARAYVRWLSREAGAEYRLPSESEWEYVARGGTTTLHHWGGSESGQCVHANGADQALKRRYSDVGWSHASCDDGHVHTSPVGSFSPNRYGLHDVSGNVSEWVEDCWHESYAGAPSDGRAWTTGSNCNLRVLRGGSWIGSSGVQRSALRNRRETGHRYDVVGFRVARTLD